MKSRKNEEMRGKNNLLKETKEEAKNSNKNFKTFVIDTNVFIHRPDAILSFRDNEVVIPLWVLEELDRLKSSRDERGRNARQAIRFLDEISAHGDLREGVKMENGSTLRVMLAYDRNLTVDLDLTKTDNRIILAAYALQSSGKKVFFVSKDISARVKAMALGIKAVDYEKQKIDIQTLYSGCMEMDASEDLFNKLRDDKKVEWQDKLVANQFVVVKRNEENLIGRYDHTKKQLELIKRVRSVSGIKPLNERQQMAVNLLLDDNLPIVTLVGKAGTGKTLLAIAAGLKKVLDESKYKRVLVTRPVIPMGKDIGYLPGDKSEKLYNWMQPLFDNLEYITSVNKRNDYSSADVLIQNKLIELEALTYIRGRSLPEQFIIIDEAQNLTPHEVKTIVSRAGTGTKVVLTGDPYQIDSPYLDSDSNGLTYLVEILKGQEMFGHIILEKSERSQLAELAAELL
jgi:PhoH-like ATPase